MTDTRIWKWVLKVEDKQEIQMPKGAEILHVDVQDGAPCLWALVDVDAAQEPVVIHCRGTNHMTRGVTADRHIGTVLIGPFVWHFFR